MASLGTQTENWLATSTTVDNILGGLVPGSEITAFSVTSIGTSATAPSGVLEVTGVREVPALSSALAFPA